MNDRDCVPSPKTVIGSPASACRTKFGITMPYRPLCRGPDGVEEPHDDDRQLALFPVRERQELVDAPCCTRTPSGASWWGPRTRSASSSNGTSLALAVHLGRRSDDDQLLLLVGVLQHDLGAVHVGFDRVDRLLDDEPDADGGGEMKDDIAAVDELGQQRLVLDRVDEVLESRPALQVGDVADGARREIVEDEDFMSPLRAGLRSGATR